MTTSPSGEQLELTPDTPAADGLVWRATRAIPPGLRQFGKIVSIGELMPGDLMLTRETRPDAISRLISTVQEEGGYEDIDARWTHAAMYVGDGVHVVEATFENVLKGGNVRMTRLDEYCGHHCLRIRRSRFINDASSGFRLVIRALSRMKSPYAVGEAARMWFDVKLKGRGLWDAEQNTRTQLAVICSTLYADAYNESTRRSLGEINGVCVPAWLSVNDEFNDVPLHWASIARRGRR